MGNQNTEANQNNQNNSIQKNKDKEEATDNKNSDSDFEIEETEMNEEEENTQIIKDKTNIKYLGNLLDINSHYILNTIFEYVSNKKKLYLIKYSKSLKEKVNLTLKDYKLEYLNNILSENILNDYIYKNYDASNYDDEKAKRKQLYKNIITNNCDEKIIDEFIIKKFEEEYNKYNGFISSSNIDINNPFFNSISKIDLITGFSIVISDDIFTNENLITDLNNFFMKSEVYPCIILSLDNFDQLKLLKINYKIIKRLSIKTFNNKNQDLKKVFSFFEEKDKLEDLSFFLSNITLKAEILEEINNFINLKSLRIFYLKLDGILTLKLANLNKIFFLACENIAFDENIIYNLETIDIFGSEIIQPKSLLKFPKLKYIETNCVELNSFIDLNISNKLKKVGTTFYDCIKLDIPYIKYLLIEKSKNNAIEDGKDVINKILEFKDLKMISLKTNLNDESIGLIKKTNLSVDKIIFVNINILNNFLEIFQNLTEFKSISDRTINTKDNIFEIKENKNSKINKIEIVGIPNGILFCQSYDNLKSLNFIFVNGEKNIEKIIPLFNDNCNVIFKSLYDFSLEYNNINDEFLKRLKINLDCIPYLYNFTLIIKINNISKSYYYGFIRKILSKKISNIKIKIKQEVSSKLKYLSKQEILKIYSKCNFVYHGNIIISKYIK